MFLLFFSLCYGFFYELRFLKYYVIYPKLGYYFRKLFLYNFLVFISWIGERGSVVGWGTMVAGFIPD
jgi:hypothetical protein